MPKVFEWKGWRFEFYSLDHHEPPHIHIRRDRKETKIWLEHLTIARNKRCTEKELNALLAIVRGNQKAFLEKCMSILEIEDDLLEPVGAHCTETDLIVRLENGASLATPLWWYPSLLAASMQDRNRIELSPYGLHWPHLDEDLSIEGMLKGVRYPHAKPPAEAAE